MAHEAGQKNQLEAVISSLFENANSGGLDPKDILADLLAKKIISLTDYDNINAKVTLSEARVTLFRVLTRKIYKEQQLFTIRNILSKECYVWLAKELTKHLTSVVPLSAEFSALCTTSTEASEEMNAMVWLTQNLFDRIFQHRFGAGEKGALSLVLGISPDAPSDVVSVHNLLDYKSFLLQNLNKAPVIALIESDCPSMIVGKLFTEWRNREFQNYDQVFVFDMEKDYVSLANLKELAVTWITSHMDPISDKAAKKETIETALDGCRKILYVLDCVSCDEEDIEKLDKWGVLSGINPEVCHVVCIVKRGIKLPSKCVQVEIKRSNTEFLWSLC